MATGPEIIKVLLTLYPIICIYDSQIIYNVTPHPFIALSILLIVTYYLHTHEKDIPERIRFLREHIILLLISWMLCMLMAEVDDIIINVYKL